MAYNVKLSGEDVEVLAVSLHRRGQTDHEERLAVLFARIMRGSRRLNPRYVARRRAGQVYPLREVEP